MKEKIRHLTWYKGEWTQKSTSLNKRIHTWFERLHRIYFPIILQHTPRFLVFFSFFFLWVFFGYLIRDCSRAHWLRCNHNDNMTKGPFLLNYTHTHSQVEYCLSKMMSRQKHLAVKIELIEYFKWARTWESEWHTQAIKWYFFSHFALYNHGKEPQWLVQVVWVIKSKC